MAAEKVYLVPEKVWDYFFAHRAELQAKSLVMIAECKDFGVEVYLTEEESRPMIVVYMDDSEVYAEKMFGYKGCVDTTKKVYDKYIYGNAVLCEATEQKEDAEKKYLLPGSSEGDAWEVEIAEREDELTDAFVDLIYRISGEDINWCSLDFDEMCDDIKEHVLEYMARKHGIQIYRPMFLVDDKGEEFLSEYPYECMIFEDENNPIYK